MAGAYQRDIGILKMKTSLVCAAASSSSAAIRANRPLRLKSAAGSQTAKSMLCS
jgi:hypothetical protein